MGSSTATDFSTLIRERLAGYGADPVIEFEGTWYTGEDLTGISSRIEELARAAGVPEDAPVALVVRNRVPHAAAMIGLVGAERSFALVYAFQSAESMARDVDKLRPAVLVADREDWTAPVVDAARRCGTVGLALSLDGERVSVVEGLDVLGPGPFAEPPPEPSVQVLTSGTTGPPKRIAIRMPVLERAAQSALMARPAGEPTPSVLFAPFGGISGVCSLIAVPYAGGRTVLLEKFSVEELVANVKRFGLKALGGPPAVIRMILGAGVPREDLASVQLYMGGAGPLEPELKQRFEEEYGIPVLWSYGATEFAGGVLTWTWDLYQQFGAAKRASSGRPYPGVRVRIVDPATGDEVPTGERGILEAQVEMLGPEWIRTNDFASRDEDDFFYLHGRADGAINRGGFKVLPESVISVLVEHPAVQDAGVVGAPDERLGEVPFAAVELVGGAEPPTEAELKQFVRDRLPAYAVPARVLVVDRLPRTGSLKVSVEGVRALAAG
ncbi:class I adenylate-forming enzyme family protein [Blastococcus sp. URHD0036]|uniref:class I adenylate-forming enzyme family protein n=1 Tax=Blastococcus sp. URHD0036 TaxID=1380356 RepID=UPI000494F028|nr:fatty acid--CoA ligase family protein [Blastococcus sp. URHD0036]